MYLTLYPLAGVDSSQFVTVVGSGLVHKSPDCFLAFVAEELLGQKGHLVLLEALQQRLNSEVHNCAGVEQMIHMVLTWAPGPGSGTSLMSAGSTFMIPRGGKYYS